MNISTSAGRRANTRQTIILSITLLGVCGMILFALGHKSVIHGSRLSAGQPVQCKVESSFLGIVPLGQKSFPGLKKASLGASRGGKNNSVSYSTWVDCDTGYVALLSMSGGSEESHRALVQQINEAVNDPARLNFLFTYGPHPLFNFALILVIAALLLFALWMTPAVRRALGFTGNTSKKLPEPE